MFKFVNKKGFTLVEIMVVVFVIGILLFIAIPAFTKACENARTKSCIANLKQINVVKTLWSLDGNEGVPVMSDLVTDYIRSTPACPADGTYTVNALGEYPTCTVPGHEL